MEERFLPVKLDDAIIKATNEDGEEKLRLSVKVDGKTVMARFPTVGNWDFYNSDVAKLLLMLSISMKDMEINPELISPEIFSDWAFVTSQAILSKKCTPLILQIYFKYLRPTVEGMEDVEPEKRERWIKDHMGIDAIFYIFVSILQIEDWLKKKASMVLRETFPNLIKQSSNATSQINSTQLPIKSAPSQSFDFV